jgi:hypothetical protein
MGRCVFGEMVVRGGRWMVWRDEHGRDKALFFCGQKKVSIGDALCAGGI